MNKTTLWYTTLWIFLCHNSICGTISCLNLLTWKCSRLSIWPFGISSKCFLSSKNRLMSVDFEQKMIRSCRKWDIINSSLWWQYPDHNKALPIPSWILIHAVANDQYWLKFGKRFALATHRLDRKKSFSTCRILVIYDESW